MKRWTIVADQNFIEATRDTGYRSTTAALAELIDNALQAQAEIVRVDVQEEQGAKTLRVAVLDDGSGMARGTLREALRFGGSARFNDRTGLGRFGMGLPNSSLSQCRRLEVYSWRHSSSPLFSYLDVDEISTGRMTEVPVPRVGRLPPELRYRNLESGTLVLWRACDRVGYIRPAALAANLRQNLSRIYRHFLWRGKCIRVNGEDLVPRDPLMEHGQNFPGRARSFGTELTYEMKVPGEDVRTSLVRVRFSLLPVRRWAGLDISEKRRHGIVGRGGVSVVRADREIDHGWYLMGSKRRENYDDWWRCEIRFEPDLDEYFGVTHSKQGIIPSRLLEETLSPDLESIARELNARVRREFGGISKGLKCEDARTGKAQAAHLAEKADWRLPPVSLSLRRQTPYYKPDMGGRNLRYRISAKALRIGSFYQVDVLNDTIVVTVNTNHPFFDRIYVPACRGSDLERFRIESVLLAAARADLLVQDVPDGSATVKKQRQAWSDALFAFLGTKRRASTS